MVGKTFILLHVLALVMLVHCAFEDEYKFVGNYQGKNYWASFGTIVRGKIYLACQKWLGPSATTATIDSLGEWNYIKAQISADFQCAGCTRNFWTNGKYNQPTANDEGVVITITGSTVTTKIEKNTNVHRHICEVPGTTTTTTTTPTPYTPNNQDLPANPTPVQQCLNDNDVIVLLDSSGSIGAENYKIEKVFAYDLARVFSNRDSSRFGFTIFSSAVQKTVPLNDSLTDAEMYNRILNAVFMAYQTNTHLAIDSAVAEYAASTRPVQRNIVVVTDGVSNNPTATLDSVNKAKNAGIRTFSVGFGSGTSKSELLAIAGGNPDRTFTANNVHELTALLNPLRRVVCN